MKEIAEYSKNNILSKNVNWSTRVFFIVAISFSLFHIYAAIFGLFGFIIQRGVHLAFAGTLIILQLPLCKSFINNQKWLVENKVFFVLLYFLDFAMIILLWASVFIAHNQYMQRLSGFGEHSGMSVLAGAFLLLIVLEISRRKLGYILPFLAILSLFYAYLGPYLPEVVMHRGYNLERIFSFLAVNSDGMFGITLNVSSTIIFMFVLFGAFLEIAGANEFVNKFAIAVTGKQPSGPAIASVIASALMGTINGSAVANVVGTGSFTIPLMKKRGYKPEFAGGVESVASTGGQILPPVMGAGAFIMVAFTKISYTNIIIAATIPAILYFLSVAIGLVFRSKIRNIESGSSTDLPPLFVILKDGFLYIPPIVILIYTLLISAFSPMMAAFYATVSIPVFMFFSKSKRINFLQLLNALKLGGENALTIVAGCACAGVIVAMVALTGLGVAFSDMMLTVSGGNLFLTLLLTAISCIILGMGLPTTAAYIITAAIIAPALQRLGVYPLAAHLFVFYYACLSAITPPVALAAYAAAGIADSNPMQTAIEACKLGIVGFIVPFMFVYNGVLLAQGSFLEILFAGSTSLIGVVALMAGVQGYFLRTCKGFERIFLIAGGIILVKPGLITDITGFLFISVIFLLQFITIKKNNLAYVKN